MPPDCVLARKCHSTRQLPVSTKKRKDGNFSRTKGKIYYNGTEYPFDAGTFRYFETEYCGHHLGYAIDKKDVYLAFPQSCGGDNCGSDYDGYYWHGLGAQNSMDFEFLDGNYARDGNQVIYLSEPNIVLSTTPKTFEVYQCGGQGLFIGRDKDNYFLKGKIANKAPILNQ
jgi:hypothetical protein